MNIALLEELVIRKAESFQRKGIPVSEAIDRAGDEILSRMTDLEGHGSRFCLRMCLAGAKKRVSPETLAVSAGSEGDKFCRLIQCADQYMVM